MLGFTTARRLGVLLAALAGATLAALGSTAVPSPAATFRTGHGDHDGRIVLTHVSFRRDAFGIAQDVLVMRPDGSDARQLTHNDWGQSSSEPAWGPHRKIYFESGPLDDLNHLYRMNANGGGMQQITRGDGGEFLPSPSPDGERIAFDGFFPTVAPDGAQGIYLTDEHGGSFEAFTRLTVPAAGGFDTSPNISPDGRKVAFRRVLSDSGPDAAAAVFVVGVNGRGLRQVTPYELDASYPRWSPNGRRLLFSSNRDRAFDRQEVWVVDADGSDLTQLTHGEPGNPSFQGDWSPDGKRIVFAHFLPTGFFTQLLVMDADGSDQHVIWQGADFSYDLRPDWADA